MSTLTRIRSDFVHRYHLSVSVGAAKFDAFKIELMPLAPVFVTGAHMTSEDLWLEALRALRFLRAQPCKPLHSPSVFQPFAFITALDSDEVSKDIELGVLRVVSRLECPDGHQPHDDHTSHAERVRALCRMADLHDMVACPSRAVN